MCLLHCLHSFSHTNIQYLSNFTLLLEQPTDRSAPKKMGSRAMSSRLPYARAVPSALDTNRAAVPFTASEPLLDPSGTDAVCSTSAMFNSDTVTLRNKCAESVNWVCFSLRWTRFALRPRFLTEPGEVWAFFTVNHRRTRTSVLTPGGAEEELLLQYSEGASLFLCALPRFLSSSASSTSLRMRGKKMRMRNGRKLYIGIFLEESLVERHFKASAAALEGSGRMLLKFSDLRNSY